MKRQILISLFLLAIFCVGSVSAQKTKKEKPDFSGTWILDESKSNKALKAIFKSSKNVPSSNEKTTVELLIEHLDFEFKITETVITESFDESGKLTNKVEKTSPVQTFYTDKRGERNVNGKNLPFDSRTTWQDKKILVVIPNKKENFISSMQFSLSKDGKELTVIYKSFEFTRGGIVSPLSFGNKVFNKSN